MDMKALLGKPKNYNIKGVDITLKPLTTQYADLVFDLAIEEKRNQAAKELIKATLENSGYKMEDFDLSCFKDLLEAVLDINGLKED